jgi:hypothetical protein
VRTDGETYKYREAISFILGFNYWESPKILNSFMPSSFCWGSLYTTWISVPLDFGTTDADSLVSFLPSWLTSSWAGCTMKLVEGRHVTPKCSVNCVVVLNYRYYTFSIAALNIWKYMVYVEVSSKTLWRWFINTIIVFLDIIHRPVCIQITQHFGDCSVSQSSGGTYSVGPSR